MAHRGSRAPVPVAVLMGLPDMWAAAAPPAGPLPSLSGGRVAAGVPGMTPAGALAELLAGNRRFVAGEPRYGHHVAAAVATAGDQHPFAVVLGCVDSRVPVEAVFDQGFGAIFVARSAGHVLDRAVLGSVEFAVTAFAVPLVMVLGHTGCGAVRAATDALASGARPGGEQAYLVDQLAPAVTAARGEPAEAVREHVRRTVASLHRLEPVRRKADTGALTVQGAVYRLDTGRVEVI